MAHLDSAVRESMRLNGFVARGVLKTVLAPGGATLPDGTVVPRGAKVGIQAYSVHRDGDFYPEPERYDAFRFVRGGGAGLAVPEGGRGSASGSDTEGGVAGTAARRGAKEGLAGEKGEGRPEALVTTSERFLAFSHGSGAW